MTLKIIAENQLKWLILNELIESISKLCVHMNCLVATYIPVFKIQVQVFRYQRFEHFNLDVSEILAYNRNFC